MNQPPQSARSPLARILPALGWLRSYDKTWLRGDIVAAITLAASLLPAVLRYQFALSEGNNGLQLQKRYEEEVVPTGFGDPYQAVYAGINDLIFGDRLKLKTGAEYSSMHDAAHNGGEFAGWTYLAGVRVYF